MTSTKLRVGLFGAGVVGGGVYELIARSSFAKSIDIVKICVKSLDKTRDFTINPHTQIVTNYDDILNDPSINCVIELIGGTTNAKDIVFRALQSGKHVVTANKALIATYLPQIQQLLKDHPTSILAYEAAVCGGIPIINALQTDFLFDNITKIMGIMNGTTNFMLSNMEDSGADYNDVLREAQQLGFAEADPTADVEGHDVQAKIALLAKLSFGKNVPVSIIPTTGISSISKVDFDYAKSMRSTIKLLGTAVKNTDGSLAVFVSPTVVPLSSPLSAAKGPGNMVLVNSQNLSCSSFAGPGAGRYPTANSVVNDLLRIANNKALEPFPIDNEDLMINNDYQATFYVRIECTDGLGIVRAVGAAAEDNGVSIRAILQNPITDASNVNFVVTTNLVELSKVQAFVQTVAKMSFAKGLPLFMPML